MPLGPTMPAGMPGSGSGVSALSAASSLRRLHSRSALPRELVKTSVEEWLGDEVENAPFDRGPDRGTWRGLPRLGRRERRLLGEGRHVLDGYLNLDLNRLLRRRRDDGHGPAAAQEPRHLGHRPNRGRQPDTLRWSFQQHVESLQADGEVGTALVAGDRVHLVEDHRFDAQ